MPLRSCIAPEPGECRACLGCCVVPEMLEGPAVNRDNQQNNQPNSQEEIQRGRQREGLEVLIDLELKEESEGLGWKVEVVEHLRLQVPADSQRAWLEAELQTWDPWLRQQKGFLGREVLWDKERQEGVLYIHWANRQDWKSIPGEVVAAIQNDFESLAKQMLALPPHSDNPFPLTYAGEKPVP